MVKLAMGNWFAKDTFRNGGIPNRYLGIVVHDKLAHFLAGAVLWLVGAHIIAPFRRFELVILLAIMWEVLELVRWIRWQGTVTRDATLEWTEPWPAVTDQFSWRDIVATMAGALVAWGLTWR